MKAAKAIIAGAALLLSQAATASAETIVLQADPWCPHTCPSGASKLGYMVDIAKEALALQGYEVVYKNTAWARAMQDVRSGKADGAVGALRDEASDLTVHNEPLGHQVNAFIVRQDDTWTLSGLDSMKGRSVATIQDYSYSTEIDKWIAEHHTAIQSVGGENALERNLKKLLSRRVDVVIDDEAVLVGKLNGTSEGKGVRVAGTMPGGELFIAFTKAGGKGDRFAKALDQGISQLRSSGRLQQILGSYGLKDRK